LNAFGKARKTGISYDFEERSFIGEVRVRRGVRDAQAARELS
jgi:hypothetical protein